MRHLAPLCSSENELTRTACRTRIAELRKLYLKASEQRREQLFPADVLSQLRVASLALKAAPDPTLRELLRSSFGHPCFRPGQEEIIRTVLGGLDCLAVMPTGAGKSLTFQIPSRRLGGITLVISPLIALMKDQVDALLRKGLHATFLNSSLSEDDRRQRISAIRRGSVELVYAAPEGIELYIGSLLEGVGLKLVAVDEAHCISDWGHDFRPAYRNLAGLKTRFRDTPMLALTATATKRVQSDIISQLGMRSPAQFQGSCFRPNLKIHAIKKGTGPKVGESILRLVQARTGESGIIYCLSRKSVDELAQSLTQKGVRAEAYHAGLDVATRNRAQERFRSGQSQVIVATVAFGMGIDKSDIRYVIHRDMPKSIEGYAQEIGRAGRDGESSDCILFYAWPDVLGVERMADSSLEEGVGKEVVARRKRQARDMYRFADAERCRHAGLAQHFGEEIATCGESCDICLQADILRDAKNAPSMQARRSAAI